MSRIYRITADLVASERRIACPRISPDGRTVAFVATEEGRSTVRLAPADVGPESALDDGIVPARGAAMLEWLPDSAGVVLVDAGGGLIRASMAGERHRIDLMASALALAAELDLDPGDHGELAPTALALSPDGRTAAVVLGDRLLVTTGLEGDGVLDVVTDSAAFVIDPCWSPDGRRLAWHEWDADEMPFVSSRIATAATGESPVVVVAGGEVGHDGRPVAVGQPRFSSGGRLGFLSDAGGWMNLWVAEDPVSQPARPALAEPSEHGPPTWSAGNRTWAWAPEGNRVAFTRNEDGFGRLLLADLDTGSRRAVARGVHRDLDWRDGTLALVRSGAKTPTRIEAYDTADLWERFADASRIDSDQLTPAPRRRAVARGPVLDFDAAELGEPEVVRWASLSGGQVTGRLYRPRLRHRRHDPPRLLVWTHGGPSDQWQVEFRPKIAYFVEREWSVLVPDHRGSSGHGRAWLDLLEGQWGVADVEDTVAAMEAAVARGWGVPEQMVPIGASAGGFTSLGVAAARPDLCRAVVAMYPVVDLVSMATTTHRWERAYDPWLIGSGADGKVNAAMRSPLAHAASLERPLLLLHGTADPVVPFAHSDLLADAILRAGRTDVVLIRYPGAGHGFSDPEHAADSLRRIDAFLATHVTDHR